jgi:hypothetical protein
LANVTNQLESRHDKEQQANGRAADRHSYDSSTTINRLKDELESARVRHEQDARRIFDLEIKLEDALSSLPPPPPPPVSSQSRSQEIQVLREQNLDQAEQIQVLVSELSKLRADNANTSIDYSSQQQTIEHLQNELRHQRERYEDLKSAFDSLERVKLVSMSGDAPHQQFASVAKEVERNIEGGYSTSTPYPLTVTHDASVEKATPSVLPAEQLLRDRTAQLELYQERAEAAEKRLEELRSQLVDMMKAEAPMKALIADLQARTTAQQREIEEFGHRVLKLTEEKDALISQLEDRDYQLLHTKRKADSNADQNRIQEAHSWWSYVWHETKKLQNYGASGTATADTISSQSKYKELIRNQAIELANARQELIGKKLVYQREIASIREQLDLAERESMRLNQQLRNQKAEKEIKLAEMGGTIRILSQRGELHGVIVGVRQELEAERIANHHLKSEVESYQSIVDSQQLQISSLRKDVSILKATAENLEVASSLSNIPGADPASVIEAMSGNFVHLQLELSKARAIASGNHNQLDALQKTMKINTSSSSTTPSPTPTPKKKSVAFADLDSAAPMDSSTILASSSGVAASLSSVEEKESFDQWSNFQLPSSTLASSYPILSSKPTPQQLLDNLDAALLAQKILAQESMIASLQTQLLQQRQIIEQIEQQRVEDRDVYERNDRLTYESQQQQFSLLQQAYNHVKEELDASRKKAVDCEKKMVELQSAVTEQELYHRQISDSHLPSTAQPSHPTNHIENLEEELEHTKHMLRERTTQLKVLMETIDSLQLAGVGNDASASSNAIIMSSGSQSWANQALVKRVVELSAELTSSNATIAQNDRRIHQLETESRRRGLEMNSLKSKMKQDDDTFAKMKQHLTALTSQLKDSEKLRLDEQIQSQEQVQKLTDEWKAASLTASTFSHRLEEAQQQLKVYGDVNQSSNKEFQLWLKNMIFEHDSSTCSTFSDSISLVSPQPASGSEVRELIVRLLSQWRSDVNVSDIADQPIAATIGNPYDQSEQMYLTKVTNLLLSANEKCLHAAAAQQHAQQETNYLKQQLAIASKRLENAVKYLARYRHQLTSSRKLIVSQQHSIEYHHSELVVSLSKSLSKERDRRLLVTSDFLALKKKLNSCEIDLEHKASQLQTLNARILELEALRPSADVYPLEEKIKQSESSLQSWFNVELPRLITGLPVTEDTYPASSTFSFDTMLPIASRLTRDLGLDKTFALSQALCAAKVINAAFELKYTLLNEKYATAQERNVELEGVIMRWKQEIEYIHRIRQSSVFDFTNQQRNDQQTSESEKLLVVQSESNHEEDILELKGRLDFALQRLEQQQLYINELALEESGLQQESSEQLALVQERIQREYDRKLQRFKEEFAQSHADDMKVLEELVQEAKRSATSPDTLSFIPLAETKETPPSPMKHKSSRRKVSTRDASSQVESSSRGQVASITHTAATQTVILSTDSKQMKASQRDDITTISSTEDARRADYERIVEADRLRYVKAQNEIQELQQLLTFQRQLLDEQQQQQHQLSSYRPTPTSPAMQTSTTSTMPMEAYTDTSPIDEESVLHEDVAKWQPRDRLLDDIIDSLQRSLSQPLPSRLESFLHKAALNALRLRKLSFHENKPKDVDQQQQAVPMQSPVAAAAAVTKESDIRIDRAEDWNFAPIVDSIQYLTSSVKDLESHITSLLNQAPDTPTSSSSSESGNSRVSFPEQYLYILRDLRTRVSDLERQYLHYQDDLVRQQQSVIAKAIATSRAETEEIITKSESRANDEINRLKNENRSLREQHHLILKSHDEQIRSIRQRYESSLSQAQEALSSQTSTAKEEIQRLSTKLSQLSEAMVHAVDAVEYRSAREEAQRYKAAMMEASRDLEIARDQSSSQQQLYLKQIRELQENHARSRREQVRSPSCDFN